MENYFEEAEVVRRREQTIDAMEASVPDSQALDALKTAMCESVLLMDREYYAMTPMLLAKGDGDVPEAMKGVEIAPEHRALSPQDQEKLAREMMHDELTGVYNRSGYDLIRHSVDLATTAFLLFDADKFKNVNDYYGHEVGDRVLQKIANALKDNFRSDDYICRIGGDGFMVLMVHISRDVRRLIEHKVAQINDDLSNGDDGLPPVTVSAGVALCRETDDPQELFHDADMALYYVKDHGRDGCCFYSPEMREKPDGRA